MAARGWANSTMTAVGIAAGAGAAQFGLGYGLGIVTWQPVHNGAGNGLWLANLTWSLWIAASSAVLGAVYAKSAGARRRPVTSSKSMVDLGSRIAMALAAAIGALVTVPLVALPARAAFRADTFRPEVTAGAYTVVGVLAGLIAALIAVNVRVIAANVVASTAWVWLLATVSVADAVRAHRTAGTAQLAAWQFIDKGVRDMLHVPGAFLMLGAALLIGVFSALPADRRADNRFGIAVSGAFGPLLVAAAYLLSAPKPTVRMDDTTAYGFSAYAVIAGLAGSVFVAVLAPLRPRRAVPRSTPVRDAATSARGTASPAWEAAPPPGVAAPTVADSDLAQWTSALAGDPPGYGLAEPPLAAAGAGGTTAAMDGFPQTATGWATVAEPVSPTVTRWAWSDVPRPRETSDFSDPAAS